MNAEQMLSKVNEAVKNRPDSASKKFALYHDAAGIHCEPVISHPPEADLIGVFDVSDLKKGFTNKQWSKIMSKCARIMKAEPE